MAFGFRPVHTVLDTARTSILCTCFCERCQQRQQAVEELVMDEEWAGRNGRGEEDLASAADAHEEEEESWEDWQAGEGEDEDATKSLFDDTVLPSVEAALEYDARTYGFDLLRLRSEVTCASCSVLGAYVAVLHTIALLPDVTDCRMGHFGRRTAADSLWPMPAQRGMREYDVIACINFIRAEVAAGQDPRPAVARAGRGAPAPWSGERFLQPALPNDPLLAYDWEDEAGPDAGPPGSACAAGCGPSGCCAAAHSPLLPCCPCLPLCCRLSQSAVQDPSGKHVAGQEACPTRQGDRKAEQLCQARSARYSATAPVRACTRGAETSPLCCAVRRAAEAAALREENEALRHALRQLSLQAAPAELQDELQARAAVPRCSAGRSNAQQGPPCLGAVLTPAHHH